MPRVLNRSLNAKPYGFESWEQAKSVFFSVLGYEIKTDEALRFHKSQARHRIVTAEARGGKSYAGAFDSLVYALQTRPRSDSIIWSIGPTYKTNKEFEYLYDIFVNQRDLMWSTGFRYRIERALNSPQAGDMEIRFVKEKDENGREYRTRILGLSASNEETLQGEEVTYCIQSEAAEHPEHIYRKYLESRCWHLVQPTTPKQRASWLKELCDQAAAYAEMGLEHIHFEMHERWIACSRPEYDAMVKADERNSAFPYDEDRGGFLFRWNANPTYDWERFAQAKRAAEVRSRALLGPDATAKDDPYFAEQFLGLWAFYSGRVLPFMRDRHVIPLSALRLQDFASFALSIDYGYEDPSSAGFWGIHPSGIYVRLDEVYERRLTSPQFVAAVKAKQRELGIDLDFNTGDPRRPEVSRLFHEEGLPVHVRDKRAQSNREAGYRRFIDLLTEGPIPKYPGLYITDRCIHAAKEWELLAYKDGYQNEYSEAAIRGEDHAVDDTRYFLMTRPSARITPPVHRDWIREERWKHSRAAERFYWPEAA